MFAGAHHSSFAQRVRQYDILSESKTILPESDLILLRRKLRVKVLSSGF